MPRVFQPRTGRRRSSLLSVLLLATLLPVGLPTALDAQEKAAPVTENPDHARYVLPPERIREILTSDKNYAELSYVSPDGRHFLIPHVTELSTLELMSRETYRLAGLELRPRTDRQWHLDTWGIDG